jgi:hypothetical protein
VADFFNWAQDVLKALGYPVTTENVLFLDTWHSYEESTCKNNPLNTTLKSKGSTDCVQTQNKAVWVQAYPTPAAGTTATVNSLKGAFYGTIRNALATGDPFAFPASLVLAQELDRWGSTTFATWYLANVGQVGSSTGPGTGSADTGGPIPPQLHRSFADLRNSVNNHLPRQLERSHRTGLVTLRILARRHRVGR